MSLLANALGKTIQIRSDGIPPPETLARLAVLNVFHAKQARRGCTYSHQNSLVTGTLALCLWLGGTPSLEGKTQAGISWPLVPPHSSASAAGVKNQGLDDIPPRHSSAAARKASGRSAYRSASSDEDQGHSPVRNQTAAVFAGATAIRIEKFRPAHDPLLESAYAFFQEGRLDAAIKNYEAVLKREPTHIDALTGLAASRLRQGEDAQALSLFQRVLELDPRNGLAHNALVSLRPSMASPLLESHLKTALADQGGVPILYFGLGNLYARQGRWQDARHAYALAVEGEPGNPDYLFNLAVSLDQLAQWPLARRYYAQALAVAEHVPPAFERSQAEARLRLLSP